MLKYKDIYAFRLEKDINGIIYNREDDNYLSCRKKGKIFRISEDVLKFVGFNKIRIKKVDKLTGIVAWDYSDLLIDVYDTDGEREITFKEENLEKLEDLFKLRKRIKRILTEEQKEVLRVRFAEARKKMKVKNAIEITDEEILEQMESEDEDLEIEKVEDLDNLESDNENDNED